MVHGHDRLPVQDQAPLLERAVELYAHEMEARDVQVRRDYARDLPVVWVDAEAVYQAARLIRGRIDAALAASRVDAADEGQSR